MGPTRVERDITDLKDLILDLPMLTDQAEQALRTRLLRATAADSGDHAIAPDPARLHGHVALNGTTDPNISSLGSTSNKTVPTAGMTRYKR
jgi:hypothetical protein